MEETPNFGADAETLRLAMDRLGAGQLDEAWLERFAQEVQGLVEMGNKLDEMDLTTEMPANIFVNRGDVN